MHIMYPFFYHRFLKWNNKTQPKLETEITSDINFGLSEKCSFVDSLKHTIFILRKYVGDGVKKPSVFVSTLGFSVILTCNWFYMVACY